MIYSYIKPRKKSALSQEIQLMLSFFAITIVMLLLTYLFLVYKDYTFTKDLKVVVASQSSLEISLAGMKKEIAYIEKQKEFSERIYTKNSVLKDSISNLFDLVPQRITLSEAILLEKGLVLYGITPNKDIYNFMLQAPLRSIFHRTYSSFYPAQNGWYRFVSTNYVDEDGLNNEN
jgi:hypothetical protein